MRFLLSTLICLTFLSACTSSAEDPDTGSDAQPISSPRQAEAVHLGINHLGLPFIAWTEEDSATKRKHFSFAVSKDAGISFGDKVEVPIPQEAKLYAEGMPKLAFTRDGSLFAIYQVKVESTVNPYAIEVHYIVSKDDGGTWSQPKRVHADSSADKARSYFDVANLPDGGLGVCWLDTAFKQGGRSIRFARTDASGRFVDETLVDSVACECCRTAISCDASGKVSIVYRDILQDSIRDISVATSTDGGKHFSKPVCFSGDNWNIDGCPHNGPDVASDSAKTCAVWYTGASENGVYYAEIGPDVRQIVKKRISANGQQIQLAPLGAWQQVLVYNEADTSVGQGPVSPIMARLEPGGAVQRISSKDALGSLPVVIGLGGNSFLAAWIEEGKGARKVFWKRVTMGE